ncbi:GNAT family N-acetyltransferase [Neobacillus citreus]|uniref:GNAT family N-acetyltransferase n=1 Tax=Neobacillus citreus TaxID=2833578 RepID=A0A9J6MWK0_9BACI|nr:GNAT family N-acetyltransferase [Neobacillus citreus]MCH6264174.1 GNAT family N-acetyltransferase [Neobacillus citreus]
MKEIIENISLRTITSPEELALVTNLERIVWADDDPVPVNHYVAVVKNGGLVIGAFLNEKLIGFQYSFPGFNGSSVYLCSHSMGIHPDYRRIGIGEKLKRKQREVALEKGYKHIEWTYDPLETVNGYLNLSKLGGACKKYIENCYGDMPDVLNAGMPSDRFLVEWRIAEEKAEVAPDVNETGDVLRLINVIYDELGFPVPESVHLDNGNNAELLYVPVPGNIQEIKIQRMSLALEWRMRTREVFTHYFNNGWMATALKKSDQSSLYYYVLQKAIER